MAASVSIDRDQSPDPHNPQSVRTFSNDAGVRPVPSRVNQMEPACARAQPDDAMTAQLDQRPAAIRVALPFLFRHWRNQPAAAAIVAGSLLGATVADLFMPLF